ncbi:MAG: hypothetical protein ACI8X3_001881, partial [Saprospiraceae bacterium]
HNTTKIGNCLANAYLILDLSEPKASNISKVLFNKHHIPSRHISIFQWFNFNL